MKIENNYTYLFQPGGNAHNPTMRFIAPSFAAEISAEGKLGLSRFGFFKEEKNFKIPDFSKLDDITCNFKIIKGGESFNCTGTEYCYKSKFWYWCAHSKFRIIEAGRFVNKADIMDMIFDDKDLLARFEICTAPDSFILKFDGYSKTETDGGVEFSITFPKEYKIKKIKDGWRAQKGECYLGISSPDASVKVIENTVIFSNMELGLTDSFKGITARFYVNSDGASECNVEIVSHNQEELSVTRLSDYGFYQVNMEGNNCLDFNISENRNKCDRVAVKIENPTNEKKRLVLCFAKEGESFPITGMSPMWRDAATGEPNGIPVQITKDWHIHPDERECSEWFAIPLNATRRYLEGKWSHLYSYIEIEPYSSFAGEFVCAFENWGTAPAVSHAQLSLVGWGGYDIWEQLATGSHGENICFQADCSSQAVSFINDIRPLYHAGRHGGWRKYDWSENVGGGELLVYYDKNGNRIEFTDILRNFKAQCPVVSEADYRLITQDGKIGANLTINNVRTDDVLRIYFNIEYEFLKDVDYTRLALFQFDTDRYQANMFRKFAHGDGAKILEEITFEAEESFENGYNPRYQICKNAGKEPWFYFYDTPEKRKSADYENLKTDGEKFLAESKNSTVLIALRSYNAVINGKKSEAKYSIRQCYSSGVKHQSVEINPHTESGVINEGSKVFMCVELVLIPSSLDTYYGTCEYLLRGEKMLDTPECALYQIMRHKQIVEMKKGKVVREYPLAIECESDGAEFTLCGGLGYVPMRFDNLSTYSGFTLYKNSKRVDQSVIGNDFWQTYYDSEKGTYSLTFSVPNESGKSTFKLVQE